MLLIWLQLLTASADTIFYGMGGAKMRAAGVNTIIDISELAVLGIFDVVTHLPKILKALNIIKSNLLSNAPDLLILVDYPGFNMRLLKTAKKAKIKVLYYIAPKIWASRPWRIKSLQNHVDKMAVIFPFEVEYFKNTVLIRFRG